MSLSDDTHNDESVASVPSALDVQYYQELILEGQRAIKGAVLAVIAAELILAIGGVTGTPMWAFPGVGGLLIIRHIWQIRQAYQQLNALANKD